MANVGDINHQGQGEQQTLPTPGRPRNQYNRHPCQPAAEHRARVCRGWLQPEESSVDGYDIEAYACAEQLPSSFLPPDPPTTPARAEAALPAAGGAGNGASIGTGIGAPDSIPGAGGLEALRAQAGGGHSAMPTGEAVEAAGSD